MINISNRFIEIKTLNAFSEKSVHREQLVTNNVLSLKNYGCICIKQISKNLYEFVSVINNRLN